MKITNEQLNQLIRIYNTFMGINTRGEDTLIMADCLRALQTFIGEVQQSSEKTEKVEAEPMEG